MPRLRFLARHRVVTDPRTAIDPRLLGRPLATPWRRAAAFAVDLVLSLLVAIPWMVLCGLVAMVVHAPSVLDLVTDTPAGEEAEEALQRDLHFELASMIARRRPEMLPPGTLAAITAGDRDEVERLLEGDDLMVQLGSGEPSSYDRSTGTLRVHGDVVFGRLAPLFGFVTALLAYFTFGTRWGRGSTPGKRLLGLRVVRLDGRPLRLWDAFGRAGGYGASLSTFALGFLEALWTPNRQALHDRLADTVVVRRIAETDEGTG